jgi:hypothetical protein
MNGFADFRRTLRLALATAALSLAQSACATWPQSPLVSVDAYDRTDGTALAVYVKDGRRYIVGTPGHEYAVRIRNCTPERILAVTSVDGVNVVSGETASPEQSGYVIEPYGSVEIAGWRKSLERTAAFYFTDLHDSYAARTGRPANVGIIGVAVFKEKQPPIAYRPYRDKIAAGAPAARAEAPAPSANAVESGAAEQSQERDEAKRSAGTLAKQLGTGHGRSETSYAQRVAFERATSYPAETIAIQYDRRENLIAMGVLPSPRYAQRNPDPFPGMRFVPDPR